ncbi:hypothetical protein V6N13_031758 [Hibiscus sabdariffa]|uniref:Uncharacterized protein n=2 Tax=Hibiscus sabdariffa TaxID=183260 RepID=A0ABR2CLK6_9ROSI
MVARGMIKEKKNALKPRVRGFKVRVTRVKADVRKMMMMEDQIQEVLRLETEVIVEQSASNWIQLGITFDIVGAHQDEDEDGDDEMSAALTAFPSSVSDNKRKL